MIPWLRKPPLTPAMTVAFSVTLAPTELPVTWNPATCCISSETFTSLVTAYASVTPRVAVLTALSLKTSSAKLVAKFPEIRALSQ